MGAPARPRLCPRGGPRSRSARLRPPPVARRGGAEPAPSAALDPAAYVEAILRRFDNPALPHRLAQIAMDGSQKLPQRWLATLVERAATGLASPAHLRSVAAWLAFVGDASGGGGRPTTRSRRGSRRSGTARRPRPRSPRR
ncbi:hypothetical protein ACFSTI_16545 [Rhizorhabdus histidinilytica]